MTTKSLLHSSLLDNQYYTSMLVGNTAYEPSDEDILAEEVLASSQASVTFSSLDTLAAGYQHLQIRAVVRMDRSSEADNVRIQFNNDTSSNYTRHQLHGRGAAVVSEAATSQASGFISTSPANSSTTGCYGGIITDILDPFETGKYTTIRTLYGQTNFSEIGLSSAVWMNTSALTEIDLFLQAGSNFVSGSRFTLIGLK